MRPATPLEMNAARPWVRLRAAFEEDGLGGFLRKIIQKASLRTFPLWEALGLHVLPDHFYYPAPNSRTLTPGLFARQSQCVGLRWNTAQQLERLKTVFSDYLSEDRFAENDGLSRVDRAILHATIRHHKPRKMIEIGSGATTSISAIACSLNEAEGYRPEFIAIDPSPRAARVAAGVPNLSAFMQQKVQDVDVAVFADCDLLFIDSSHVVGIGSDVNFEQLEVLPRLKPGCLVHFHDILLPGEYWSDWVVGKRYYWSEQYLLWAFLLFNQAFEVVWASRYMQLTHEAEVQAVFPFYSPNDRITSFWIQRASAQ